MSKDCLTHAIEHSETNNPISCRLCRYYDAHENAEPETTGWNGSGRCKYYPPTMRNGNRGFWPGIDGDESVCSKFIKNWER